VDKWDSCALDGESDMSSQYESEPEESFNSNDSSRGPLGHKRQSTRQRTDSEIARALQQEIGFGSEDDEQEEADAEYARRLQRQLAPDAPPRESLGRIEAEDSNLARAVLSAEIADAEDRRQFQTARFASDERDYMRARNFTPWFCRGALAVTTFVMFLEIAINGFSFEDLSLNPTFGPSLETLVNMGAKSTDLILEGDWWRLFTPMLLHAGLLHLLFNMVGLYNIGFPAEREFGSLKIGVIYVASGIIGVLFSAVMLPNTVSVGASGAIFGLFGSAWADLIHNWSLYRTQAKSVLLQLTLATVFNLGLGLMPFLDNFAHIGGFICGMTMGFTFLVQNRYDVFGNRKARLNYQLVIQATAITIVPVLFVVLLIIMYLELDPNDVCTFCSSLSCVPMPPGADDADLWWDCHECSQISSVVTPLPGDVLEYNITCPGSSSVEVTTGDAAANDLLFSKLEEDKSLILTACKTFC